jgi:hypothetical protein
VDSVVDSELLVKVGKRMMRITEGAGAAADGDVDGDARTTAIAEARAKHAEYERTQAIAADSAVLAKQFAQHFAFHVELLRDSLAKVDA